MVVKCFNIWPRSKFYTASLSSSLTNGHNKQECLSLATLFGIAFKFTNGPPYSQMLGKAEKLARDKQSSLVTETEIKKKSV
jgi:hypothetical protein